MCARGKKAGRLEVALGELLAMGRRRSEQRPVQCGALEIGVYTTPPMRGGAYSAAEYGLTALTTHIACQYGAQGIRCNAVAPGVTVTPAVVEACVVGAPDDGWGAVVVAFIVGDVEPADLGAHLLERIARFERPKRYEFIDELPKTSYGKVLKRELRNRLSGRPV